jgi:predicted transcriptional regulator
MNDSHEPLPVIQVISFREALVWVRNRRRESDIRIALSLNKEGFSNSTIAKLMEIPENSVRELLGEKENRVQEKN